jgi:hypothetical protein
MKQLLFTLSLTCMMLCIGTGCRTIKRNTESKPVSHEIWDDLLKRHVTQAGWVNYKGMIADSVQLNLYLKLLSKNHPNDANWSKNEQMAYWINAYNAFTVKLICDHYPVKSIKDIKNGIPFVNTVWDIKFIEIEGFTYDLNNIEHNILRPVFKDPRIHAAINCASYSCPPLQQEAFVAEKLDAQLDHAMRSFLEDSLRNKITSDQANLSKIFDWFSGDFKDASGSVRAFIGKYNSKMTEKTKIDYLDYAWQLNDIPE